MPASSPWLDQYAPPQWRDLSAPPGARAAVQQAAQAMNQAAQNTSFDSQLHFKVAGTIVIALVIIFALQAMGFRFVTSANATIGVGR